VQAEPSHERARIVASAPPRVLALPSTVPPRAAPLNKSPAHPIPFRPLPYHHPPGDPRGGGRRRESRDGQVPEGGAAAARVRHRRERDPNHRTGAYPQLRLLRHIPPPGPLPLAPPPPPIPVGSVSALVRIGALLVVAVCVVRLGSEEVMA
jgi:hypothetical protein